MNKKVLGAMKDETAGKPVKEFCGLRSKTYIYDIEGEGQSRRAKGIKRNVAGELMMDDYRQCVEDRNKKIRKKMVVFKSFKHQIYTERIEKCALNGADDKRFIRADKISTYAYGHKNLEMEKQEMELGEWFNELDEDENQSQTSVSVSLQTHVNHVQSDV